MTEKDFKASFSFHLFLASACCLLLRVIFWQVAWALPLAIRPRLEEFDFESSLVMAGICLISQGSQ